MHTSGSHTCHSKARATKMLYPITFVKGSANSRPNIALHNARTQSTQRSTASRPLGTSRHQRYLVEVPTSTGKRSSEGIRCSCPLCAPQAQWHHILRRVKKASGTVASVSHLVNGPSINVMFQKAQPSTPQEGTCARPAQSHQDRAPRFHHLCRQSVQTWNAY